MIHLLLIRAASAQGLQPRVRMRIGLVVLLSAACRAAPSGDLSTDADHPADADNTDTDPTEVDLPPLGGDQNFYTDEEVPVGGSLTVTDPDGDAITWTLTESPTAGILALDLATGAFTYTPGPDVHEEDHARWSATAGGVDTGPWTATFVVAPINDAPVAIDPAPVLLRGTDAVIVALLATDVDGDALTFSVPAPPVAASAVLQGSELTLTAIGPADATTEFIAYEVSDGAGGVDASQVSVTYDFDADGLKTEEETIFGTDPAAADTDGDTVPDGAEALLLGSDPLFDETAACSVWPATSLSTGPVDKVAIGDIDGDGLNDLAAANMATNDAVAAYQGPNGVTDPVQVVAQPLRLQSVSIGDTDGDGIGEVLTGNEITDTCEAYEYGAFGAPTVIYTGYALEDPSLVDLDADGDADLLAKDVYGGGSVFWYRNDGAGGFTGPIVLASWIFGFEPARASDLDGDGDVDVAAVAVSSLGELGWLENLGGGVFASWVVLAQVVWCSDLALGDVDGDGVSDIVAFAGEARVFRYAGAGVFTETTTFGLDANQGWPADIDGDADLDLVIEHWPTDTVSWVENLGLAGFGAMREIAVVPDPWYLGAADLDNDGRTDVIVRDSAATTLEWYQNDGSWFEDQDGLSNAAERCLTGTDPAVADTDGGGTPDLEELLRLGDPLDPADD